MMKEMLRQEENSNRTINTSGGKNNRIELRMEQLREKKEKALITYLTAGLPDLYKTESLIKVQAEAGVDIIEVGVPFSDPVADGPVIQDASYRSILNGTNLVNTFQMVEKVRKTCEVPIVFMMYYNTIFHYGLDAFAAECAKVGVDGIIVPDLPYEEQEPLKEALAVYQDASILIQLVAPVSKDRIPMVLKNAKGFVYCVSQMGVTGGDAGFHKNVKEYLKKVREATTLPLMIGFGIRSAADVLPLKEVIDGAIVGSEFIRLMEHSQFDEKAAENFVATFKKELNQ